MSDKWKNAVNLAKLEQLEKNFPSQLTQKDKNILQWSREGQGPRYGAARTGQKPVSAKSNQYQTKGKKSLLTSQSTRSKGGGKSSGGGGGKFGIINRSLRGRSPWHHLKRLLE